MAAYPTYVFKRTDGSNSSTRIDYNFYESSILTNYAVVVSTNELKLYINGKLYETVPNND
jgi:hypothetical protein